MSDFRNVFRGELVAVGKYVPFLEHYPFAYDYFETILHFQTIFMSMFQLVRVLLA